jgi:CelD/BcsL family acetyltransferase involved in cellulose biosynthesis
MPPEKTCETVLATLTAGGTWIASKLSLICSGSLHSWFSVYDPQHRRHGPGHLLWFKVIEAGCERGIRTFDFGEGESDYKAEYGGEGYEVWKGVLRSNTVGGNVERILQSAAWRLERLAGQRRAKPVVE